MLTPLISTPLPHNLSFRNLDTREVVGGASDWGHQPRAMDCVDPPSLSIVSDVGCFVFRLQSLTRFTVCVHFSPPLYCGATKVRGEKCGAAEDAGYS